MPTMIAIVFSTALAYLPDALFGDSMSTSTEIFVSMMTGTVSYAVILWYFKRLRGG